MKAYQTLLFLISVLLILVGLCFIYPEELSIGGFSFRYPTLEQALSKSNRDKESAEDKLRIAEEELQMKIDSMVRDSLDKVFAELHADSLNYVDSLNAYHKMLFNGSVRISFPNNDISKIFPFFETLERSARGKELVRILHYGDSQIEADRISSYIRQQLQQKFGGYGPGMAPAIQPIPSMSVSQFASDSLPRYIADGTMRQKLSHNRYGVLAQMAQLDGSVTLNYSARNWKKTQPRTKQFSQIRLLVGKTSDDFSATLKVDGIKDSIQYVYDPSKEVNVLKWQLDSAISNFKLSLSGKAEIYGVAIDGRSGVAVDNIPLRGSSGTFFHRISPTLLAKSMDALNVRMILLEFGGNATPYVTSDESVEDYKQMIARQIKYLKTHYPKAQILLIGPADMSMKIAGELQTYPFLEEIVSAMEEAALENGAYFWNMYQVMGGRNSMVKWVEHQPAWAASDYIHFTETGANKIAGYFVQSFMNYYDYYQFLKRNKEWSGVE